MSSIPSDEDRRLNQQQQTQNNRRTWGDPLLKKEKECVRIVFQNLNGFGHKKEDEAKTKGFL